MARYFGIDSANERLRDVKPLLEQLRADRDRIAELQPALQRGRETNGSSEHAKQVADQEQEVRRLVRRMQESVTQIDEWGVTLRDIQSGLIDFPALVNGRPIWLCWRLGEDDIAWWHEKNVGFEGRQALTELT